MQQLHMNHKTPNLQSQGNCTTDTHEPRTEENRLEMNVQQSHKTERKKEKNTKRVQKRVFPRTRNPRKQLSFNDTAL